MEGKPDEGLVKEASTTVDMDAVSLGGIVSRSDAERIAAEHGLKTETVQYVADNVYRFVKPHRVAKSKKDCMGWVNWVADQIEAFLPLDEILENANERRSVGSIRSKVLFGERDDLDALYNRLYKTLNQLSDIVLLAELEREDMRYRWNCDLSVGEIAAKAGLDESTVQHVCDNHQKYIKQSRFEAKNNSNKSQLGWTLFIAERISELLEYDYQIQHDDIRKSQFPPGISSLDKAKNFKPTSTGRTCRQLHSHLDKNFNDSEDVIRLANMEREGVATRWGVDLTEEAIAASTGLKLGIVKYITQYYQKLLKPGKLDHSPKTALEWTRFFSGVIQEFIQYDCLVEEASERMTAYSLKGNFFSDHPDAKRLHSRITNNAKDIRDIFALAEMERPGTIQRWNYEPGNMESKLAEVRATIDTNHTVQDTRRAIEEYGFEKLTPLAEGIYTLAVTIAPWSIKEYVDLRLELGPNLYNDSTFCEFIGFSKDVPYCSTGCLFNVTRSLDRFNVLKLAKDTNGESLTPQEYSRSIQNIFVDQEGRVALVDEVSSKITAYLTQKEPDFSDVSIIEEETGEDSKNPTLRARVLFATNPKLESNDTIEAFVKFYPEEWKDDRDFEVELRKYLAEDAEFSSVKTASDAKLERKVLMPGNNEAAHTAGYGTCHILRNWDGVPCGYALAATYVNMQTTRERLAECKDDPEAKKDYLSVLVKSLAELHVKGSGKIEGVKGRYSTLEKKFFTEQGEVITEDYQAYSRFDGASDLLIEEGSELDDVYNGEFRIGDKLNELADDYRSLVNGDGHPGNSGVDRRGGMELFDFDKLHVHLGTGLVDLGKSLKTRYTGLKMEDQLELVEEYTKEYFRSLAMEEGLEEEEELGEYVGSRLADKEMARFKRGYHQAAIYLAVKHAWLRTYVDKIEEDKRVEDVNVCLAEIREHARELDESKADRLVKAVAKRFDIGYNPAQ